MFAILASIPLALFVIWLVWVCARIGLDSGRLNRKALRENRRARQDERNYREMRAEAADDIAADLMMWRNPTPGNSRRPYRNSQARAHCRED